MNAVNRRFAKGEMKMSEALSGCAVRAAIQQEKVADDAHYFRAIKLRLEMLYELTKRPNLREQISDEIDWVNEKLGTVNR